MKKAQEKVLSGTPFRIVLESIENRPNEWNSTRIKIYKDLKYTLKENVYGEFTYIGEYVRNYNAHGANTFYPFMIGDDWFALYSAHYTATRVMRLLDDRIEDWCGEESSAIGFCPVEYYIPTFNVAKDSYVYNGETREFITYSTDSEFSIEGLVNEVNSPGFVKTEYCNFGFVSGCVWGDDSSWKLRYIDLSKIMDKQLAITEKFGYVSLPDSLTLKKCINMSNWEPENNWIHIVKQVGFNLVTGDKDE